MLNDLLDAALCWHCSDPLDDEPVYTSPVPGHLVHLECAIENHPEEAAVLLPAPFTLTNPTKIVPGNTIHSERHGVVIVDEVRRTTEGWVLLGYPPARNGEGRRVTIPCAGTDEVVLLADESKRAEIHEALSRMTAAANSDARRHHDEQWKDHEVAPAFDNPAGFYGGDDPRIVLDVRGTMWSVPVAPTVPPAPTAAAQHTAEEDPAMLDDPRPDAVEAD